MKFKCKKCGYCCKNFGGFLPIWEWEAEELKKIAKEKNISLDLKPAELWLDEKTGFSFCFQIRLQNEQCPFIENNQCSIYKNRPLICRCFPFCNNPLSYSKNIDESFFGNCPNLNTKKFLQKLDKKNSDEKNAEYQKLFGEQTFQNSFELAKIKKTISEIMEDLISQKKIKLKKVEKSDYSKYPNYLTFFEFLVKAKLMDKNTKEKMINSFKEYSQKIYKS